MTIVSIERPTECPPTPGAVKRELIRLKISQREAARLIGLSPAMVSMVLNRRAESSPCLRALARLIQRKRKKESHPPAASMPAVRRQILGRRTPA